MSTDLPPSPIPLLTTATAFREWREKAMLECKSVGLVPTMGALHEGHLSLVRRSLMENDLTVVSIFVNPAQFALHEDLTTYPKTLEHDITALADLRFPVRIQSDIQAKTGSLPFEVVRTPSAIFLPNVNEMYPSGITQDVASQKGTFVEVKGYSHQMEGKSRPTFFRGVATVVTKLFNVIQPTRVYFGQKDIQQALLLKRLTSDLLMSHPLSKNVHILPTVRDPRDGLALSSRNAYLSQDERTVAPTLYEALTAAEMAWEAGLSKVDCLAKAHEVVKARERGARGNVDMCLDFIEINDANSFDVAESNTTKSDLDVALLNGALYIGKTRLIDNLILGDITKVIH